MTCSVKYIEAYLLCAEFNLKARMKTAKPQPILDYVYVYTAHETMT